MAPPTPPQPQYLLRPKPLHLIPLVLERVGYVEERGEFGVVCFCAGDWRGFGLCCGRGHGCERGWSGW